MRLILLIVGLFLSINVYAEEIITEPEILPVKYEAKYVNCTSSSNIWLNLNNKDTRIALIAYDKEDGSLNDEIDKYICSKFKDAKLIEVEYDERITSVDKYNRQLLWIYIDGVLLQDDLISKGYGQVNYINDEYKYLTDLCATQKTAISNSLGIWNYEGIKESYCKSGIKVGEKIEEEKENKEQEKKYDIKSLRYIILLSSGIVVLLLFLRGKTK